MWHKISSTHSLFSSECHVIGVFFFERTRSLQIIALNILSDYDIDLENGYFNVCAFSFRMI